MKGGAHGRNCRIRYKSEKLFPYRIERKLLLIKLSEKDVCEGEK